MSNFVIGAGETAVSLSGLIESPSASAAGQATLLTWGAFAGCMKRVDDHRLWGPAFDPATGVQAALAGRLAFEQTDWARADRLPFKGGNACRLILESWFARGAAFCEFLNGAGIVLLYEPEPRRLHLVTDRLGIFPVYFRTPGQTIRIASHPDLLADWLALEGQAASLDLVTLAECLATGTGVHPHSYYSGIAQLDPASHYVFEIAGGKPVFQRRTYWKPSPGDNGAAVPEAAWVEEMTSALRSATRRRTLAVLGKPGLLLSGGADSRALLFAASEPAAMSNLTFCDRPNRETGIARRLSRVAGAPHRILARDAEHYAQGAAESVRISGGFWSVKDAHYEGFKAALEEAGFGVLLSGCYADYLLKGLALNRTPRKFLGRALPLYRLGAFDFPYYQPHARLAPQWAGPVLERLEKRFPSQLRSGYEQHAREVEDLRIRPLSREADAMGRLYLLRTCPWDPVMSDLDIIRLYERLPVQLKLNGRVFVKAVARIVGSTAGRIPDNAHGAAVDAGDGEIAVHYLWRRLGGKMHRLAQRGRGRPADMATEGSWPDFGVYVARSRAVAELWSQPSPFQRELFGEMLGQDPWSRDLATWGAVDVDLFLRLLTLKIWLGQRGY